MKKYPEDESDSILIYDIETATVGPKPDGEKDKLKIFGFYSYKIGKFGMVPATDIKSIQKIIDNHKFMVGFNNEQYDDLVLKRSGISLEYKRIIDLRKRIKQRAGGMITHKGMLGNVLMKYSLDYITRFLDLVDDNTAKDDIDYNIFKKERWTKEDIAQIKKYTKRDIEITKKLYEWVEDYFESFKDFVPKNDVDKKYYLTDTIAKFAYKAICHSLGWEPEYDSSAFQNKDLNEKIVTGGYVAYPAGEKFEGDIYCLDFNSLYPSIMIQCNLYSRNKKSAEGWHGSDMWKVEGFYDDKELNPVGKLLRAWYYLRLKYKRKFVTEDGKVVKMLDKKKETSATDFIGKNYYKVVVDGGQVKIELSEMTESSANEYIKLAESGIDRREYTVKIIINTVYGLLLNPYYKLVFDAVGGGDCTRLGRQWTKYARKIFHEAGYVVIYTDTDSWYVIDVFNDKKKLLDIKQQVIDKIKDTVPFPQDMFDAGIDDEIKYMFFFKGSKSDDKDTDSEMDELDIINKSKGLMKKNYIYVTKENNVKIKNLGIKKKNISALSKKIFWKHIVPKIISDGQVKFSSTEIDNVMKKMLKDNLELAYMRKEVGHLSAYAKSRTGIQAQISQTYGPGIHFLIPNKRGIGIGKKIKYCSIEEFKQYKMEIGDIDLQNFWKELNYFVIERKQPSLFDLMG